MKSFNRFIIISALCMSVTLLRHDAVSQEGKTVIYKVTASVLVVRAEQNVKSKALFSVPKGSYVYSDTDMQSRKEEVIANRKGRWINYCGRFGDTIGYVFEGFLERDDSVKSREMEYCEINGKTIKCDSEVFNYNSDTPVSGAYFQKPETESGDIAFFYSKKSDLLKKISDSGGASFIMIVKDNNVLQFIATPPPRGYE